MHPYFLSCVNRTVIAHGGGYAQVSGIHILTLIKGTNFPFYKNVQYVSLFLTRPLNQSAVAFYFRWKIYTVCTLREQTRHDIGIKV